MLKTVLSSIYLLLQGSLLMAQEGEPPDLLKSAPKFSPNLQLTETLTDSAKAITVREPGEPPYTYHESVTKFTSTVRITANIAGIDLSTIGPDTPFRIELGQTAYEGSLGEDPTYTEITRNRRTAFIAVDPDDVTGIPKGIHGIKLTWSATLLTMEVKNGGQLGSMSGRYVTPVSKEASQPIRDSTMVSIQFADRRSEWRPVYLQGTTRLKKMKYSSGEELNLENVAFSAAFDTSAPVVAITAPSNNTITSEALTIRGTATDTHGIWSIQYTTTPQDDDSWTEITNITDVSPARPASVGAEPWGSTRKQWAFDVGMLPYGTNTFYVRCTDPSGNRSAVASITAIHLLPVAWRDRWDGLPESVSTEHHAALTLNLTSRGSMSGSLRVQGASTAYPFKGTLNGNVVKAVIPRPGMRPLMLEGVLNPDTSITLADTSMSASVLDSVDDENSMHWYGEMHRSPYSAAHKLSSDNPALGRSNVTVSAGDGVDSPAGYGYFSAQLSNTGMVTLAGELADGTKLNAAAPVGAAEQLPLFVSLYGNKGSFSILLYHDLDYGGVSSNPYSSHWNRPPGRATDRFANGFAIGVYAYGSHYSPPPANTIPDGFLTTSPNAFAVINGDGVSGTRTENLHFTGPKILTVGVSAGFTATFNRATGLMSGTITLTETGEAVPQIAKWSGFTGGSSYIEGHYILPPKTGRHAGFYGGISIQPVEIYEE